jgi:hypothetical protein
VKRGALPPLPDKRTCTNCNPKKEGCQGSDDVTAWPHQILLISSFRLCCCQTSGAIPRAALITAKTY